MNSTINQKMSTLVGRIRNTTAY